MNDILSADCVSGGHFLTIFPGVNPTHLLNNLVKYCAIPFWSWNEWIDLENHTSCRCPKSLIQNWTN